MRPEGCLSDFALDRMLAGEPGNEAHHAHRAACERCTKREAELRAERDAFQRDAPPLVLPRKRWIPYAGLAVAASILLFVFVRPPPSEDTTRTKGTGVRLGFYVKHHDAVRAGGPNERVEPGDSLRFVVASSAPRWVAVLSLDGARKGSVYVAPMLVEAGGDVPLPTSTVLDDVLGDETLYALQCPTAFDAEPIRAKLETSGKLEAPAGCSVDAVPIRKEARTP